jgi:hypothetical protein
MPASNVTTTTSDVHPGGFEAPESSSTIATSASDLGKAPEHVAKPPVDVGDGQELVVPEALGIKAGEPENPCEEDDQQKGMSPAMRPLVTPSLAGSAMLRSLEGAARGAGVANEPPVCLARGSLFTALQGSSSHTRPGSGGARCA